VQKDFPGVVYDTDVHFFGMQVDSAIKFVLFGVKSHMASSFGLKFFVYKTTLSYFETFEKHSLSPDFFVRLKF